MAQRRRQQGQPFEITAMLVMRVLAGLAMLFSLAYWLPIQSILTPVWPVAGAMTAIIVVCPPGLASFFLPWSPGAQLLARFKLQTWGGTVALGALLYMLYYTIELSVAYWLSQADAGRPVNVPLQVGLVVLTFIIIPGLMWAPVKSEEALETIRQAHLVKRYELQTEADLAIMRANLLRAQEQALIGLGDLLANHSPELRTAMTGLAGSIRGTLRQIHEHTDEAAQTVAQFDTTPDAEDIVGYLTYVSEEVRRSRLLPPPRRQPEPEPEPRPEPAARNPSRARERHEEARRTPRQAPVRRGATGEQEVIRGSERLSRARVINPTEEHDDDR